MNQVLRLPSPLHRLHDDLFDDAGVEFWVKRDDLIHPLISGNKWRKLSGYLEVHRLLKSDRLVSFGGAFSNHLIAVAATASYLGLKSFGVIRTREEALENPVITHLRAMNMKLELAGPAKYEELKSANSGWAASDLVIPEGGAGLQAFAGIRALATELLEQIPPMTHLVLAIGTGTTLAALSHSLPQSVCLKAISPFKKTPRLKTVDWMAPHRNVQFIPSVVPNGFAGYHPDILPFIDRFFLQYGIVLDPVYTSKALMSLYKMIEGGHFPKGSKIVFLHTGGLSGMSGYIERFRNRISGDYPEALNWDESPARIRG